jgi:gamma-glutamylcyclotransferase (GGCT)/AIG2-like uncharacterized protein YtfP
MADLAVGRVTMDRQRRDFADAMKIDGRLSEYGDFYLHEVGGGMILAINGTLMREQPLNEHLRRVGGRYVDQAMTSPSYRLFSINDQYPAMIRATSGGGQISVERWEVAAEGLVRILEREPPGLCLGRIQLADGQEPFGILAEPYIIEGHPEITRYGGWREYLTDTRMDTSGSA